MAPDARAPTKILLLHPAVFTTPDEATVLFDPLAELDPEWVKALEILGENIKIATGTTDGKPTVGFTVAADADEDTIMAAMDEFTLLVGKADEMVLRLRANGARVSDLVDKWASSNGPTVGGGAPAG